MIEDLLSIADGLVDGAGERRPRQANLRRALSTAYYALFHALAKMCADELIGVTQFGSEPWVRVYRSLEHGRAKDALSRPSIQALDPATKAFSVAFVELQEKRHTADYDPRRPFPFGRRAARGYIQQARQAILDLNQLQVEHRRILATAVLFKSRP